jgi:4-hydroxy-tetrahydrodipicolinate synthase
VVGTSTHFTGPIAKDLIEAYERGDNAGALALHRRAMPLFTGIFRSPGTMLVKAGLRARGLPAGPVRSPLVDASDQELSQLRLDASAAGLTL